VVLYKLFSKTKEVLERPLVNKPTQLLAHILGLRHRVSLLFLL
jgi:hypothetical protein